jgi:hypothetical protein
MLNCIRKIFNKRIDYVDNKLLRNIIIKELMNISNSLIDNNTCYDKTEILNKYSSMATYISNDTILINKVKNILIEKLEQINNEIEYVGYIYSYNNKFYYIKTNILFRDNKDLINLLSKKYKLNIENETNIIYIDNIFLVNKLSENYNIQKYIKIYGINNFIYK